MSIGGIGGIDNSRIQAMMAQLKTAAPKPAVPAGLGGLAPEADVARLDFAEALKISLQKVSAVQKTAEELGQRFAMGDDTVSLSDAMIAMQKSSLAFQGTVQVRNKLVSAYHEIMNMQV